jgi:regulator of RNase E activity RraA
MQDWDVYSRVEVVRALQVEETLRIQNQLGVQMANPGDYLVAGASGVIRVVAQQLFQKVYQKEHPVYSPPKSPSGLIVSR